jgi:hypothetical protein
MRRREFVAGLRSVAAWPLVARAQQPDRGRRIGILIDGTETQAQSSLAAFVQGLRQLGWIEGQNLRMDVRWNAADAGLASTYAAQLAELMPDVILAGSTINLTAIRRSCSCRSPTQSDKASLQARGGRAAISPVLVFSNSRSVPNDLICSSKLCPVSRGLSVIYKTRPLGPNSSCR